MYHQDRIYVVTGSASGIGRATADHLRAAGGNVIGVDLRDAEVRADLTVRQDRARLAAEVRDLSAGALDGVIACAGGAGPSTPADLVVRLNYFGAVAVLESLRPLLAASSAPRAVAICSQAMIREHDPELVEACLTGDEEAAAESARRPGITPVGERAAYGSAKRALARWIRRSAPSSDWAGCGIALNGISPGVIKSPALVPLLEDAAGRERVARQVPMPFHGPGDPQDAAELLGWLVSPRNRLVTGQVVFIDGGSDAVLRGDDVW